VRRSKGVQDDINCDEESCDGCWEEVSAIGDEDMDDEREDEFGKRVAVKVSLPSTVVAANVDTACWSIWLYRSTFLAGEGMDFEEGGEANAADGHSLDVAERGNFDIMLWGRFFPGYQVRVMRMLLLCAAKDETSVDTMRRMFCCNFLRKSRL
jgi:hypothetical protein